MIKWIIPLLILLCIYSISAYTVDNVFTTLKYNTDHCMYDSCVAEFTTCNPLLTTSNIKLNSISFNTVDENGKSVIIPITIKIKKQVIEREQCVKENGITEICDTTSNNVTGNTKICKNVTTYINSMCDITRTKYVDITSSDGLIQNSCTTIQINGYLKPNQIVDWIPKVNIGGIDYIQPKWKVWNSSYLWTSQFNCSNVTDNKPYFQNITINNQPQEFWSYCSGTGTSISFNTYNDWIIHNDTNILNYEVEYGNISSNVGNMWKNAGVSFSYHNSINLPNDSVYGWNASYSNVGNANFLLNSSTYLGREVFLNGVNQEITFPIPSMLMDNKSFTIILFVKVNQGYTSEKALIGSGSGTPLWYFSVAGNPSGFSGFFRDTLNVPFDFGTSPPPFIYEVNNMYMITFVRNGSSNMSLYVNSTLVKSLSASVVNITTSYNISEGSLRDDYLGSNVSISELRYYQDKALGLNDLKEIWENARKTTGFFTLGQIEKGDTHVPTILNYNISSSLICVNSTIRINTTVYDNYPNNCDNVSVVKGFVYTPLNSCNITLSKNPLTCEYYYDLTNVTTCNTSTIGNYSFNSVWSNNTISNVNSTNFNLTWSAYNCVDMHIPTIENESVSNSSVCINSTIKVNATVFDLVRDNCENISVVMGFIYTPLNQCNLTFYKTPLICEYYYNISYNTECNTSTIGNYSFNSVWTNNTVLNVNSTSFNNSWSVIGCVVTTTTTTTTISGTTTTTLAGGIIRILAQDETFSNHYICFYEKVQYNNTYRMNFYGCMDATNSSGLMIAGACNYTVIIKENKIFGLVSIDSMSTPEKIIDRLSRIFPFLIGLSILIIIFAVIFGKGKSLYNSKSGKRF